MTTTQQITEAKESLRAHIDEWIERVQSGDAAFDCYIADETATLMTEAAFSVIAAVEDGFLFLKREGYIDKDV